MAAGGKQGHVSLLFFFCVNVSHLRLMYNYITNHWNVFCVGEKAPADELFLVAPPISLIQWNRTKCQGVNGEAND